MIGGTALGTDIKINWFGVDFVEFREIELEQISLKVLKIKKQEQDKNILDQAGKTTYVYDVDSGENVEISKIKIVDGNKFDDFVFGCTYYKDLEKVVPYIHIKTSIKYFESNGEKRENNFKPLEMKEVGELLRQIKDYLLDEYDIKINISKAKFNKVELSRIFNVNYRFCEYGRVLESIYYLAPKTIRKPDKKGLHDGKRIDSEYGVYYDSVELGNDSIEEIIYNKTSQLKEKEKIELEVDFMRVEYKLNDVRKCTHYFGDRTIYEIEDDELLDIFIKRVEKDLITPYEEYLYGNTKKRKKSLYKKLLEEAKKREEYKNSKGKYKSGWAKEFILDMASLEDLEVGIVYLQDVEIGLQVIEKIVGKKNYARTYKTLKKKIDERPKIQNNLIKLDEIKCKLLFKK